MIERANFTAHGAIRAIIDGQEMFIPDTSENRHRVMIAKWEADGNTIEPYAAPPPMPKRYSKKALFEAMTEEEYATFETYEAQQSKKEARMFREATELNEADPGFDKVQRLMIAAYGKARAAEILAAAEL